MALEEQGVRLLVDGLGSFSAGMEEARGRVDDMSGAIDVATEDSGLLGGALDALAGLVSTGLTVALSVGAAAIAGLAAGLAATVPAALENEQTLARLESQLKATGGRAGLTMDDLQALGKQYQNLAGGSDDLIYSIESIGLRYQNITKDVMPQFIQASLDLAAVTGQDAAGAAQTLALALEDPAGALGRLRRAGIVFTDQEEQQIKAMVAAGDAAGAQQMVLDKLAATTGGAAAAQAETLAGKWEIFTGRLGEAAETIGMSILPVLTSLFDNVIAPAIPTVEMLAETVGSFIAALAGGHVSVALYDLQAGLTAVFGPEMAAMITDAVSQIITFVRDQLVPAFQAAVAWIVANWPQIQATAQAVFKAIGDVINNVVVPFIRDTLIPLFASAVAWVQANWPIIQATITTVIQTVQATVTAIMTALQAFWQRNGADIVTIAQAVWSAIQAVITTIVSGISVYVQSVMSNLQAFWATWGNTIMTVAGFIWRAIETLVKTAIENVQLAIHAVALAIQGDWSGFGETLRQMWDNTWSAIKRIIGDAAASLAATAGQIAGNIRAAFSLDWGAIGSGIVNGIANGIRNGAGAIVDAARGAAIAALNAAKGALGIQSPSKVFEQQVGVNVTEGMARGILGGIGTLQDAMTAAVGGMVSQAAQLVAPSGAPATALPVAAPMGGGSSADYSRSVSIGAINYNSVARPPSPVTDVELAMALL